MTGLDRRDKTELTTFIPKVSIIIPVYNGSDFLKEAIESAIAQTYENIEIIVINDGSNDKGATEKIALSYGDRICYFSKENGGVASAMNLGIKKMRGEYFSWLSHDDLYYPDKISAQIEFIAGLTERKVFLFSDYEYIDKNGKHYSYHVLEKSIAEHPELSIIFNQIHGCSVLIHKNVLEEVNGFPENRRTTQDYHTWLNILKSNIKFYHIPLVLIKSRIHENQGSTLMSEICNEEIWQFYKRIIDEFACNCTDHYFEIQKFFFNKDPELFKILNSSILANQKVNPAVKLKVLFFILYFKIKFFYRGIIDQVRNLFK
jgi:glycosyltransferase involved in cell wall biosynthesis